jgi:hypothetical protein
MVALMMAMVARSIAMVAQVYGNDCPDKWPWLPRSIAMVALILN